MCPNCKCKTSRVLHTEIIGNHIKRERKCKRCGHIFTTEEWATLTYKVKKVREILAV